MSELFIVATPIGNLGDITIRALEILKSVDVIACEDTRHSLKLLNHFAIKKPLLSCRARNESFASEKVLQVLESGRSVAYISDAGTPCVSDPGAVLVRSVRDAGYRITPVPGASAFSALLSVAGSVDHGVVFLGFLPQKGMKRKKKLESVLDTGCGVIIYESPYRILKLLKEIAEIDNTLGVVIGRELTKIHEEIVFGRVDQILHDFESRKSVKGEFCIFVTRIA